MTDHQKSPRNPEPRSSNWQIHAIVVVLLMGMLVALPLVTLNMVGGSSVQRQLDRLRAAGEPLTISELLAQRPDVPDERNSARIVLALEDELRGLSLPGEQWEKLPLLGARRDARWAMPWRQSQIDEVRRFVAAQQDLLRRLDPVADLPHGRYPIDPGAGPLDVVLPQGILANSAARLEVLAACAAVADGRRDDALRHARTIFHLCDPLLDEPFVVNALTARAIDEMGVYVVQAILDTGDLDADELHALQALLRDHARRADLSTGLRGERLYQMDMFEVMLRRRTAAPTAPHSPPPVQPWVARVAGGLFKLNQAKCLELMGELIAALDDPAASIRAAEQLDASMKSLGPHHVLTRTLMPSMTRVVTLSVRTRALLSCGQAALAAERWRLQRGDWPPDLAALVPAYLEEAGVDPFTARPLCYRRDEIGVVIYSVGEDGADDAGAVAPRASSERGPNDVGMRLLDPARRQVMIIKDSAVPNGD